MTPPITPFTPPWQQHHILAGAATSSPPSPASMYTRRTSLAHSSYSTPSTTRGPASKRSTASLRARNLAGSIIRTSGRIRQRTWSVTLDQMPDGGLKPTGLIAMDGSNLFIPHGKILLTSCLQSRNLTQQDLVSISDLHQLMVRARPVLQD